MVRGARGIQEGIKRYRVAGTRYLSYRDGKHPIGNTVNNTRITLYGDRW